MGALLREDESVLAQARAGNGQAFEALISPYQRSLYRQALKMTRNEEDAEDVVQDAVWKAFCRLGQFQGSARFSTWMMRIVINESLMKLRQRKVNPETESLDSVRYGGRHCAGHFGRRVTERPDGAYTSIEFRSLLRRALSGLSPSVQSTFTLCYIEGYTPQEIASMLGLSVAAIKSRLLRARRRVIRRYRTMLGTSETRRPSGARNGGPEDA